MANETKTKKASPDLLRAHANMAEAISDLFDRYPAPMVLNHMANVADKALKNANEAGNMPGVTAWGQAREALKVAAGRCRVAQAITDRSTGEDAGTGIEAAACVLALKAWDEAEEEEL